MSAPTDFVDTLDDPFAAVDGLRDEGAWRLGLAAVRTQLSHVGGSLEVETSADEMVVRLSFPTELADSDDHAAAV